MDDDGYYDSSPIPPQHLLPMHAPPTCFPWRARDRWPGCGVGRVCLMGGWLDVCLWVGVRESGCVYLHLVKHPQRSNENRNEY